MSISEKIRSLQVVVGEKVQLIAVSKTKPVSAIHEAYISGHRIFGENKAQELAQKYEELPKDIEWHMIGHLQTNKVKYIAPFVTLIHSVDSLKLLKEINKRAHQHHRSISCLLQVHIADEKTKFGLNKTELIALLTSDELKTFERVNIVGLMGMASNTNHEEKVRTEFKELYSLFKEVKDNYYPNNVQFCELSMGMSGDYKIAIEEGSTMVRLGSSIFGHR